MGQCNGIINKIYFKKQAPEMYGESSIRVRVRMTAFSQTEVLAETIVCLMSPPQESWLEGSIYNTPSIWLTLFTQPW